MEIKKEKLVFNRGHSEFLEVAILTIERKKDSEAHFVLSFGGGTEYRFVGQTEWQRFLDFLKWFDWNPRDTDTFEIFHNGFEEDLPFAEEIFDDNLHKTWERPIPRWNQSDQENFKTGETLELVIEE
jgi:hypothetical protein